MGQSTTISTANLKIAERKRSALQIPREKFVGEALDSTLYQGVPTAYTKVPKVLKIVL